MSEQSSRISRRELLRRSLAGVACLSLGDALVAAAAEARPPNFIVILCDDLGYQDLGCFGSPLIKTPRLDRMAAEGLKLTDFYAAAPVCTPTRAALITGCYPLRVGLPSVLGPQSNKGLSSSETTIAKLLKVRGYATACIGKWHLGHHPEFLPTRHGFDTYFGLPYSNDMDKQSPIPLLRGEKVIEQPVVQETLTERYTEEAIRFLTDRKDRTFFLYLAHTFPHVPLHVSERFKGKSKRGFYGDVVECIDWSTGEILDALSRLKLDRNTLVIFNSDNGPWRAKGQDAGSALPLRGGKFSTWEGGMRVPCIMRWPGRIPAGSVYREVATVMDLLPTLTGLAGGEAPTDRIIDGKDIRSLLLNPKTAKSPYEAFFYYRADELQAVRSGRWKLVLEHQDAEAKQRVPQALYDLPNDIGETTNVSKEHADVVARLLRLADRSREDIGDSLTGKHGANRRAPGVVPR